MISGGVFFSWFLHFLDKQQKVLYMDVLMLRSHGCEGAATRRKGRNLIFGITENYQIYSNLYQSQLDSQNHSAIILAPLGISDS